MKKFLVVFAVLVFVGMSSLALAADITVGGTAQIRSRYFDNMTYDSKANVQKADGTDSGKRTADTQERVQLDVNVKSGDAVKAKVAIWKDFDTWGRLESNQANLPNLSYTGDPGFLSLREAWVSVNLPGIPVNVTGGHQLLMLGQGYFFRSMHFGSDAWVVANVTGPNTAAFVNVKASEGLSGKANDDIDAYVLLDVFKLNENMVIGVDLTNVRIRSGVTTTAPAPYNTVVKVDGLPLGALAGTDLLNLGVNFTGKTGPVNLKAEVDMQSGKIDKATGTDPKFKGMQAVVLGNVPVNPVTINFMVGYGTGNKLTSTSPDIKAYIPIIDVDPHYTFLYEYKLATACGAKNTGLCNTTVASAGAMFAATKNLKVGADLYYLKATEKIANATATHEQSTDLGIELDAKVQWQLYDNLSWNWDLGYFKPGKAYKTATNKTDAAMGAQGVFALKF